MEQTNVTPSLDKPAAVPPEAPLPPVPPSPPDPFANPTAPPRPRFTLRRSRTDRMLGGVCGGLAKSLDVDVALLRIALVALAVFGAGFGVVAYVAAWVLAPEEDGAS